jgi:hypothetical protein
MRRPLVTAEVVFLRTAEGGRQLPPRVSDPGLYRPHLVMQGREVRQATVDDRNVVADEYLGVQFVGGPDEVRLGEPARCTIELAYFPEIAYLRVKPGATFTVREGAKVVGHGFILDRTDPAETTLSNREDPLQVSGDIVNTRPSGTKPR